MEDKNSNIIIYESGDGKIRLEGGRQVEREILFYNLDMIISLGCRVTTVSPVEQAYLDTIKQLEKKAKKEGGKADNNIDKT